MNHQALLMYKVHNIPLSAIPTGPPHEMRGNAFKYGHFP